MTFEAAERRRAAVRRPFGGGLRRRQPHDLRAAAAGGGGGAHPLGGGRGARVHRRAPPPADAPIIDDVRRSLNRIAVSAVADIRRPGGAGACCCCVDDGSVVSVVARSPIIFVSWSAHDVFSCSSGSSSSASGGIATIGANDVRRTLLRRRPLPAALRRRVGSSGDGAAPKLTFDFFRSPDAKATFEFLRRSCARTFDHGSVASSAGFASARDARRREARRSEARRAPVKSEASIRIMAEPEALCRAAEPAGASPLASRSKK